MTLQQVFDKVHELAFGEFNTPTLRVLLEENIPGLTCSLAMNPADIVLDNSLCFSYNNVLYKFGVHGINKV